VAAQIKVWRKRGYSPGRSAEIAIASADMSVNCSLAEANSALTCAGAGSPMMLAAALAGAAASRFRTPGSPEVGR